MVMGIENNEKKVNLALKLVGPQLGIYRDFYAKEWKQDLRTLDWYAHGPDRTFLKRPCLPKNRTFPKNIPQNAPQRILPTAGEWRQVGVYNLACLFLFYMAREIRGPFKL